MLRFNFCSCSAVPGKSEVSSVVYKVGEWMQELLKLWKEYEASQADKNGDISNSGPTLEVRIPSEHVTATNRQVRELIYVSLKQLRPPLTFVMCLCLFFGVNILDLSVCFFFKGLWYGDLDRHMFETC